MKTDYLVMTPGPTMVAKNVREARAIPCTNPDIDEDFVEFYVDTCKKISSLLFTQNETLILSGEGILGLEAACASLTEENDRVLVIDNGIYGKGFADFVNMYGGKTDIYSTPYDEEINIEKLREYLRVNHNYKYATVVHCDTPSGMLNDIKRICPLLKSYGILTVVDSVSGMFGNEVMVDEWQIDILCGGSQKALSAPVGLTLVTISEAAKKVIYNRMTPVKSFYGNLANFKNYYKDKWFPYTMPISDICGLHEAVLNIKPDTINRHKKIAAATRYALTKSGLKLYQKSGFSDTVTVFMIPKGTSENEILSHMKDKNILLTGSFDYLRGKVIRIGHMGENATKQNMITVFEALDKTFIELNVPMKESLKENFVEWLKIN
jgi:aspartate aminotransferase-like enzyme